MILAVIPAYNEEGRIAQVVAAAKRYVDAVLVVDDGSTDRTAECAVQAGARIVSHAQNCGAGAATMTGLDAARMLGAQIVVTLDADGQHDPQEIPLLLKPIQEDKADIVFANRFGRKNIIPLVRRVFNGIGNVLTLFVTGTPFTA